MDWFEHLDKIVTAVGFIVFIITIPSFLRHKVWPRIDEISKSIRHLNAHVVSRFLKFGVLFSVYAIAFMAGLYIIQPIVQHVVTQEAKKTILAHIEEQAIRLDSEKDEALQVIKILKEAAEKNTAFIVKPKKVEDRNNPDRKYTIYWIDYETAWEEFVESVILIVLGVLGLLTFALIIIFAVALVLSPDDNIAHSEPQPQSRS